jgi:hypothetical protein
MLQGKKQLYSLVNNAEGIAEYHFAPPVLLIKEGGYKAQ